MIPWLLLVAVLAAAAAVVVLSRLQVKVLQERVVDASREQKLLVDTQRQLTSAVVDGFDAVREKVAAAALRLLPEAQAVALIEPRERGKVVCAYAKGSRLESYGGVPLERVPRIVLDSLQTGAVQSLRDREAGLHPSDSAAIAATIPIDGGDRAVLYVSSSRGEAWGREQEMSLEHLASIAGPVYRLARDREYLSERALVDALSGTLNKTAFLERLSEEVARARPSDRIAVVYIDADHFKSWNDTYGHNSGDKVIGRLGRLYRGMTLTQLDFVGREGGDEFAIAFLGCDKTAAIRRAVELVDAIEHEDYADLVPAGRERVVDLTGSIGVAAFPIDASTGLDLLKAADLAMFTSKNGGRNRVSYYAARDRIVTVSTAEREEIIGDLASEKRRDAARSWGSGRRRAADVPLHVVGND